MKLSDAIKELAKSDHEIYSVVGTVESIDEGKRTCDVQPANGDALLYGVRLQAEMDRDDGIVAIPKKGSYVIVTFLNKQTGYVSLTSEIDYIQVKTSQDLATEVEGLIDIIDSLIGILQNFQVLTPMGPSTNVMPQVITQLNQQKTTLATNKSNFKQIIK
jgi:hypothetical protein